MSSEIEILLIQHGEAESKDVDPDRPLTEEGRRDVQRFGDLLYRGGWSASLVLHSGKLRAKQTSEILADVAFSNADVEQMDGIGPVDPVEPVASQLSDLAQNWVMVGHLPFMEKLVGQLTVGEPDNSPVTYRQGGGVCLARDKDGNWKIRWMVVPELLER